MSCFVLVLSPIFPFPFIQYRPERKTFPCQPQKLSVVCLVWYPGPRKDRIIGTNSFPIDANQDSRTAKAPADAQQ